MDIVDKIKSVLNESVTSISKIRQEKAKAKGLTHFAFNLYHDKNNIVYAWHSDTKEFIKTGIAKKKYDDANQRTLKSNHVV